MRLGRAAGDGSGTDIAGSCSGIVGALGILAAPPWVLLLNSLAISSVRVRARGSSGVGAEVGTVGW